MRESPTDNELVRQVREGHTEAFSGLIARHQARMRALVAHYVANRDDVYDLVQDAFLEAFRHLDTFDPEREFVPWLRAICRHRVLNYYRARRTHHTAVQTIINEALEARMERVTPKSDNSLERLHALRTCMGKLQAKYQQLIHLRYQAKVAVKDIAAQSGQTAASTSMLLHRVRTMLGRCIERELAQDGVL